MAVIARLLDVGQATVIPLEAVLGAFLEGTRARLERLPREERQHRVADGAYVARRSAS